MAVTRKRNKKNETQALRALTTAGNEQQQHHRNEQASEKESAAELAKTSKATSDGSGVSSNARTSVELADEVLVKFVRQNVEDNTIFNALDAAKSVRGILKIF